MWIQFNSMQPHDDRNEDNGVVTTNVTKLLQGYFIQNLIIYFLD